MMKLQMSNRIKNEIINELQEKIDSIEEAFKANNEYHKNISVKFIK